MPLGIAAEVTAEALTTIAEGAESVTSAAETVSSALEAAEAAASIAEGAEAAAGAIEGVEGIGAEGSVVAEQGIEVKEFAQSLMTSCLPRSELAQMGEELSTFNDSQVAQNASQPALTVGTGVVETGAEFVEFEAGDQVFVLRAAFEEVDLGAEGAEGIENQSRQAAALNTAERAAGTPAAKVRFWDDPFNKIADLFRRVDTRVDTRFVRMLQTRTGGVAVEMTSTLDSPFEYDLGDGASAFTSDDPVPDTLSDTLPAPSWQVSRGAAFYVETSFTTSGEGIAEGESAAQEGVAESEVTTSTAVENLGLTSDLGVSAEEYLELVEMSPSFEGGVLELAPARAMPTLESFSPLETGAQGLTRVSGSAAILAVTLITAGMGVSLGLGYEIGLKSGSSTQKKESKDPKPKAPEPGAPKAPEPKATEPKATEPKAPEPKAPEPKAPEPKATEPKATEPGAPKAPEPKAPEPKATEPKATEPKAPEPKAPEPKATEPMIGESAVSLTPDTGHEFEGYMRRSTYIWDVAQRQGWNDKIRAIVDNDAFLPGGHNA